MSKKRYNKNTRSIQCVALSKLLYDNKFTDVIFIIGENKIEISANRALLSVHSPVFEAMFYGQMIESKLNIKIPISDIEPEAFKGVLKYCYCNDPELNEDNIVFIKQIADKYQINGLSKLCDKQFLDYINHNNICKLLNESVLFKLDKFIKICMKSISNKNIGKYTKQIIESSYFMNMNINSIKLFIQSDDLLINEEKLWDVLLKWSRAQNIIDDALINTNNYDGPKKKCRKLMYNNNNKNERSTLLLKELSPFIRFGLMTQKYFIEKVKPLKCLTKDQIKKILLYQNNKFGDCAGFNIKKRGIKWTTTKFMNGLNILSRDWNKNDEIEYD